MPKNLKKGIDSNQKKYQKMQTCGDTEAIEINLCDGLWLPITYRLLFTRIRKTIRYYTKKIQW